MEIKKGFKLVNKSKDEIPEIYEDNIVPYWIEKVIDTPAGKVRVIKTSLESRDRIDGCKVRWGINRDNYKVSPGLYAVGSPDSKSQVLVTANYKLTIDKLRCELVGQDLWILVLDTKGINVWCAAGKGTFGTTELIGRIRKVCLKKVVEHNRIILPQLGAPGVAAHVVTKMTGFKVLYGPIRSRDIPKYLENDLNATNEMREVRFNFYDRLILTPIEIVHVLKYIPIIFIAFLMLNIFKPVGLNILGAAGNAFLNFIPYLMALLAGAFLVPIMLPYIPFRAFSLKGMLLGIVISLISILCRDSFGYPDSMFVFIGNSLILTSITAFIALNFTGSTTYTSLSGVKIETKWTTIMGGIASIIGAILIIVNSVLNFLH